MKRRCHASAHAAEIGKCAVLALTCLITSPGSRAEPPGEVEDVVWCPGDKTCLSWSTSPGADDYHVYRGAEEDLERLVDAGADSCLVGSFAQPTTGSILDESLPEHVVHWFLVTARNAEGEGGAGGSSVGVRVVDSSGACSAVADLVINEVDYDQPGVDSGEFVEVYNARATAQDLAGMVLILVNGQTMSEYGRVELAAAAPSLPSGGYLVVGSANVVGSLPPGTLSVEFGSMSNNMQNGAPDAVALFDTGSLSVIDSLSYEGSIAAASFTDVAGTFDLVHGTGTAAVDSNSVDGSLARSPNGSSSGDDDTDWIFNPARSPGSANPLP
jgi:hypothetical protein